MICTVVMALLVVAFMFVVPAQVRILKRYFKTGERGLFRENLFGTGFVL